MKKKTVIINKKEYELVRNDGDCFDEDVVLERITDYFYDYDYIKYMEDYIKNYCSYGSKIFLLKKVK